MFIYQLEWIKWSQNNWPALVWAFASEHIYLKIISYIWAKNCKVIECIKMNKQIMVVNRTRKASKQTNPLWRKQKCRVRTAYLPVVVFCHCQPLPDNYLLDPGRVSVSTQFSVSALQMNNLNYIKGFPFKSSIYKTKQQKSWGHQSWTCLLLGLSLPLSLHHLRAPHTPLCLWVTFRKPLDALCKIFCKEWCHWIAMLPNALILHEMSQYSWLLIINLRFILFSTSFIIYYPAFAVDISPKE